MTQNPYFQFLGLTPKPSYNSGGNPGGPWLHRSKTLLTSDPLMRRTVLALPKGSTAAGTAWTRVPFGRKMASGTIAPQPSSFTGLPSDVTTGGALQWYVPGKPFLEFAIIQ